LATLLENNYFIKNKKTIVLPFYIFSFGILANEVLLMIQGLGILFKTNNEIYKWLLWLTSILLFLGALFILLSRLSIIKGQNKKP
jgi:hypothetical protein